MATRYYIVGGAYYTWDQLHNQFGYTDHETANISYKSAHPTTWGESAGSGYFDGDQTDMVNGSFWSDEDPTAWFDLSGLVYNAEVYPADAIDCAMEKDGVRSDAVSIESDGVTYYLIRNVWDSGWMSESEAAAEGWEPAQPGPVLPVVYTHTGTQTAASIAPDASFDTGLTYDSNNLYIGETDDGLGDVTRYGWEAEEGPEPPAYTEITLYLASGSKSLQTNVTSSFTGDVNSTYCYQLYTDAECTTPWTGYDYSYDYEQGRYVDGVWTPTTRQKVSDLPSSTGGTSYLARVLLDTGVLWLASNAQNASSTTVDSIIIRIYPKAQQHYALYFSYNNLYGNYSLGGSRPGYPWPSGTSGNYMAWFASYPVPSVVKFLGSAGNEFLPGGNVGDIAIKNNSSNALEVTRIGYTNNISVRCAIFTLDSPTLFAWTRTDKTDTLTSSGTAYPLYDESGNGISYDALYSYKILGVLRSTGANCSSERNVIQAASLFSSSSALAFAQTYGSISAAKIWYIKEQRNIVVNFGDPVTIPDGFTVDSVKCTKLFVKASNISYSGHVIYFEYPGAGIYSNDTDLALFGVQVNPCIEMFGFSNASTFAGFRLSVDFSRTGYATAVSASKLNTDGYFVKGEATLSSGTTSTYVGYMQTKPMMFRLYINSAVKSYHFNVPQSVWQYQNGVFSWLGNDTDTTDLAYWYKSAPDIQINLRPITT